MSAKRRFVINYPALPQNGDTAASTPPVSSSLLHIIPWDFWLYLAPFLELSDQASLALTCKVMKILLCKSLARLKSSRHQRLLLLRRLDSSLPGHRFCSACSKYHRRNRKDERSWIRAHPKNACGEFAIPLVKGMYLNWPSIQLALRARHYGSSKYGTCLETMPRRLESTPDDTENIKWQHKLQIWISEGRVMLAVDSFRRFHGDLQRLSQFCRGYLIDVVPHMDHAYLHVRRLIDATSSDGWVHPKMRGWCPSPKNTHSWYFWSTAHWEPEAGLPGLHWTELSEERRAFGIPEWSNWRYDNRTGLPIDPRLAIHRKQDKVTLKPLFQND